MMYAVSSLMMASCTLVVMIAPSRSGTAALILSSRLSQDILVAVWCLTINDGKLYSGSFDNSIKVWNCSNHELITTLGVPEEHDEEGEYEGHTDYVYCLTINDGKLYSGSGIRQSRCGTAAPISSLLPLQSILITVDRLRIHGGKLYSQAYNVIKVYDCSDDTLITTLEDHTDYVVLRSTTASCTLVAMIRPSMCMTAAITASLLLLEAILRVYMISPSRMASYTLSKMMVPSISGNCEQAIVWYLHVYIVSNHHHTL